MIAGLGDPRVVRAAALLGAASGSRSTAGLAAYALTSRSGWFGQRPIHSVAAAAAGLEAVIDKLPMTPSRLAHGGLVVRILAGAASGALIAQRQSGVSGVAAARPLGTAGVVGALAAAGSAVVGVSWRRLAARCLGRDWPGAVAEDLAAAALAIVGTRL